MSSSSLCPTMYFLGSTPNTTENSFYTQPPPLPSESQLRGKHNKTLSFLLLINLSSFLSLDDATQPDRHLPFFLFSPLSIVLVFSSSSPPLHFFPPLAFFFPPLLLPFIFYLPLTLCSPFLNFHCCCIPALHTGANPDIHTKDDTGFPTSTPKPISTFCALSIVHTMDDTIYTTHRPYFARQTWLYSLKALKISCVSQR